MIIQKEFNREGGRRRRSRVRARWSEKILVFNFSKSAVFGKKLFAVFKLLNE